MRSSAQILCALLIVGCGPQLATAVKAGAQRHTNLRGVDAATTAVFDEDELLACLVVDPNFPDLAKKQIIILGKDKPFWDYYYTKGTHFKRILMSSIYGASFKKYLGMPERSINCKMYTPPPKPSFTLREHPTWPGDIIGLIESFDDSVVHCSACGLVNFDMRFFEKCNTPTNVLQFLKVQEEVKEKGGDCQVAVQAERQRRQASKPLENTLQSCIAQSAVDHNPLKFAASCTIESELESQLFIKRHEKKSLRSQMVVGSLKLESESDTQLSIKEKMKILGLQTVVDARKQDIVNAKHIFEGL